MINGYIGDPRTIILAVLDARNNLANQEVFELARVADPDGIRTVGIITKCDAVPDGDEDQVMRIARNEVEQLRHGWFVVRNRSTKEIRSGVTIEQRHVKEASFFTSEKPWNQLESDHCGVPALKKFLGELLFQHIKREFPNVAAEVHHLYAQAQQKLNSLGDARQTTHEQRQYLSRVANSYQRQVDDCLRGNYSSSWTSKDTRKLRMLLKNNDDIFEERMRQEGHSQQFRTINDDIDDEFKRSGGEDIYDWIRSQYRDSRGAESPGTVNPLLLESMFRQLTSTWESISKDYIREAESIVLAFNTATTEQLVSENESRTSILNHQRGVAQEASERMEQELQKLLHSERGGILQTLNHYFADTLQRIREERVLARLNAIGLTDGVHTIDLKQLLGAAHLSNEQQAVNDIHDILKAYYKVALKRFLDNVLMNVVERHLLGTDGAVRSFTPNFVIALPDEQLAAIAEESFSSARQREEAVRKLETFAQAVAIIKSL